MPVFGALVPVDWPVRQEPFVYIVDLTSQLLGGVPSGSAAVTLTSDYRWRPGMRDDVRQFLEQIVPAAGVQRYFTWAGSYTARALTEQPGR